MAFGIPWDEAAPSGATTPADTIDTELQNLKISIRERIEAVICDWADDSVDPKVLCGPDVSDVLETSFTYIEHRTDTGTDVAVRSVAGPVFLNVSGTTNSNSQLDIDFTQINGGIYLLGEWSYFTEKFFGSSGTVPLYVETSAEAGEVLLLKLVKEGGDGGWENQFVTGNLIMVNDNPPVTP